MAKRNVVRQSCEREHRTVEDHFMPYWWESLDTANVAAIAIAPAVIDGNDNGRPSGISASDDQSSNSVLPFSLSLFPE